MKKFNKLLCLMLVFVAVMAAFCSVSFAQDFSNWSSKSNMIEGVWAFSSISINDNIYVFGGYNSSQNVVGKLQMYDSNNDTWIEKKSMPTPRLSMSIAQVNGKIYTIGGCTEGIYTNITNINQVYDPATDTWQTKKSMPVALAQCATAVFDNNIYIFGGSKDNLLQNTVYVYDTLSDTWTTKTSMPTPRKSATAVVANDLIYVLGGWNGTTSYGTVEAYNPLSDKWTNIASMTEPKISVGAINIDGDIYIFGGLINSAVNGTNKIEKYSNETNSWNVVGTLPDNRGALGTAFIKNSIYIFGGRDTTSNIYNSVYSYEIPQEPTDPGEPPVITGNKAILEIVMTNGTIKEYDLSAQEIQQFLTWYDNRSAGTDKAYISIIKRSNVKPYISRNEYLQFKEIYSFEVKEYKE